MKPFPYRNQSVLAACGALFLAHTAAHATAVLTDTFDTPVADPNTIGYFKSGDFGGEVPGVGPYFDVSGGDLRVIYGASGGGLCNIQRYFPTQSLAVGETLRLDFVVTGGGLPSVQRCFRFSLGYVAPEGQLTANQPARGSLPDGAFSGFLAAISASDTGLSSIAVLSGTNNVIHKEAAGSGSLDWIGDASASINQPFANVEGRLQLTRTGEGYDLYVQFGDIEMTASHEGVQTAFNTLGFGVNGGPAEGGGYALHSVSVVLISGEDNWAGYPLVAGWADTGDFLGWVHPQGDYVYVQNLGRYVYLPEAMVSEIGGWAYLFN